MDGAVWYKHFHESPEAVRLYLVGDAAMENEDKAQKALAYDNDVWGRVMDVVWETVFLNLSEVDFQARLSRLAGDRKPEDVERTILRFLILPLADLVTWDVERRLQELGVPLAEIQGLDRVALRPVSYGAAVRRIASQAHLSLLSEEMVRRTRDILISYLKGVRLMEQVKEILQRNQAESGIGLTREQAEVFAKAMEEFLSGHQVISEQEYADWFVTFQHEAEAKKIAERTQQPAPVSDEDALADTKPIGSARAKETMVALATAVDATIAAAQVSSWDESLQKRLCGVISTRLRDVRNAFQIKDVLTREVKVGGLGLEATEVERIAGVIEQAYGQYHGQIADEEKRHIERTQTEQSKKIEERRVRESEAHAKWFQDKVAVVQKEEATRQAMFQAMKRAAEQKPTNPPKPPTPLSGGLNPSPLIRGEGGLSVDPIEPPVRLIGLTEELSELTLEAFRRISKNPEQAAAKIQQKLETLRQESFERWTEGVQSWRRSPLQQLYLKLIAQSFAAGRPVTELVEEERATDPALPTADEVGAIMALNTKIQL